MDNVILTEAFKELKLLEEEAFDINSAEELEDAKEFLQDDNAEPVVEIADVYAEEEGELLDSYVGKVILECEVCHSKIFEDADKVTIDEEENVANMDQECPFCFSNDGYKVIGQVAPFGQVEEEIVVEEEPVEEEIADDIESEVPEEEEVTEDEIVEESLDECGNFKKGDCKNDALDECGDQIIEEVCPECGKNPCECEEESLEEDFKDVSVTTDDSHMTMTSDEDGKVTVTTEPVQEEAIEDEIIEDEVGDEMIAPVDDEVVAEIEGEVEEEPVEDEEPAEDEEVDVDFDEFDEEGFDDLGESYLKKVYENVNSFRTTGVIEKDNNIIIEGLIEFDSGNKKKTSFILEARDINDKGTIRFIGENKEITKGKKAFTVLGRMNDKKFMCEALRYHYMTKNDEGTSTRVNGTIRRDK